MGTSHRIGRLSEPAFRFLGHSMHKVACYIDGFNLYHSIDDLHKPHLKWVNLWALAQSICRPNEVLRKVSYFSAYATWLPEKHARHRKYVTALEAHGVSCHMARFNRRTITCRSCGAQWNSREEKETDVHFALTFLEDAFIGEFDRAIIVSADSDYVPAVRAVRKRFSEKEVFLAAPPGRLGMARELRNVCSGKLEITPGRIAKCLLPQDVKTTSGDIVRRPSHYDPHLSG